CTGPKSIEGKAKVSRNAITHGLTSTALLLPGEDPAAFEEHRAAIVEACKPVDAVERLLADRQTMPWWKLMRAERAEAAACRMLHDRAEWIAVNKAFEGVTPEHVRSLSCIPNAANIRLIGRYSTMIWRQLESAQRQLTERQAKRGERAAAFVAGMLVARLF